MRLLDLIILDPYLLEYEAVSFDEGVEDYYLWLKKSKEGFSFDSLLKKEKDLFNKTIKDFKFWNDGEVSISLRK